MRPHPDNFNRFDVVQNLVHKAVLNIDSSRACAREITDEFFVRWRPSIGILCQDTEEFFRLWFQSGSDELLRIAFGLVGEDKSPAHQSSSCLHFSTGVFSPFTIESRIPGIDVR